MLDKKTLIFVGPLGNPTDEYLKKYDYVIRTNNFFSISHRILNSNRCDILSVNRIYSISHCDFIISKLHAIKFLWTSSSEGYKLIKSKAPKIYKKKILYMKFNKDNHDFQVKKYPLMLSRVLYHILEYYKPSFIYIMGLNFYNFKNIRENWLPGYCINSIKNPNKIATGKGKHDIESNKKHLIHILNKHRWIKCDRVILDILKNTK